MAQGMDRETVAEGAVAEKPWIDSNRSRTWGRGTGSRGG